jgi:heptosyltransferase-3
LHRLLIRPGGIGDCLLSLPALEHLKANYTEVWVPSATVPLIRFADSVKPIASTGLELMGLPGIDPPGVLIERLRSFDSIVSWYGANRDEFRAQTHALKLPFQFYSALPSPGEQVHASDFFLRQVGGGRTGGDGVAVPKIACPQVSSDDFAVIHPFSGSSRKNWPMERFRELSLRFAYPVQWSAGPQEQLDGAVRFENLYELACWLATARVYIGNDSGITHLAAAVGTPVVAIFGPTDPAIWAPRGERVRVVSGRLDAITVDEVFDLVTA